MKKMFISLFFILASLAAQANSPAMLPWLKLEVGQEGKDAKWARCYIALNKVIIENSSGQKREKNVELNNVELSTAITNASRQPLRVVALHMVETKPNKIITAGNGQITPAFVLYRDASRVESRMAIDTKDLVKQVKLLCAEIIK